MREPGSDGSFVEIMKTLGDQVIEVPVDPDRSRSAAEKMMLKLGAKPATMARYYDRTFHNEVRRVVAAGRFDVIFCDQLHMAAYGHDVPLPKVMNTDDPLYLQLQRDAKLASGVGRRFLLNWESSKYRRYERAMFKAFDSVLFVSAADQDVVEHDLDVHNIAIVPQGVDTEYFNPAGPLWAEAPDHPYILISGMMNYGPNATSAIYFVEHVLPLVRKEKPHVQCVIAGAYPTDEVKSLAERYSGVIVTGFVDDIRPIIRSASVYAAPAISGTGIKNKVLQAMAMEKGIVATPLSMDGIPQAQHNCEVLIAEGAGSLASATIDLLNHSARCAELGRQARMCITEHYAWPAIVGRLYSLLERLGMGS